MNLIERLFSSDTDEEPDSGESDKPCNVTGHDWSEWQDDPFSAHATSTGTRRHELHIYQGQNRTCRKCGKYDTRRKTLGHLGRDGDDIYVV